MPKILVTTVPFSTMDSRPIELLKARGFDFEVNPLGRKLKESELKEFVKDYDALIAGTEQISKAVLDGASRLKLISRVGIGLDNVDLLTAKSKGIRVAYTPDGPTQAVADLTIGMMLSLLRQVQLSNLQLRRGTWHRFFGRRLGNVTVGLIGVGRIGVEVLERLQSFNPRILVNDIVPKPQLNNRFNIEWVDKETIYKEADVISLHVPLTSKTKGLIGRKELEMMKPDALLVNTARGGIVDEADLYHVLQSGHLGGVALDVFEEEPYSGPLLEIERCLFTAHMGSMTIDCRNQMELEATEEVVRFFTGDPLKNEVPAMEYEIQAGV